MVAKRKPRKDERELPAVALENPYALLSREELDAAWEETKNRLLAAGIGTPEFVALEEKQGLISQGYAWLMVREGLGTWSGGKPKGTRRPVPVTPGPYVSDYIIEDRR
jgi:hypothetical protein